MEKKDKNTDKDKKHPLKERLIKKLPIIVVLVFAGIFLMINTKSSQKATQTIDYGKIAVMINDPATEKVELNMQQTQIEVIIIKKGAKPEEYLRYSLPIDEQTSESDILALLANKDANPNKFEINNLRATGFGYIFSKYSSFLWIGIIAFFFIWMMKKGPGGQAMNFMQNKRKKHTPTDNRKEFKDVAGLEDPKMELREIVDMMKRPDHYRALGARIPKGVLLVGPPGTGKTLLAKAVAGEANVPFFYIAGSEFVQMFVGVGASRVRDTFRMAKTEGRGIIFIDEIDAVARKRSGFDVGHNEHEQTLNQLLIEMDGFEDQENIVMIAATNRADILDPALLRPGRFDRQIHCDLSLLKDRIAILNLYVNKVKAGGDVNTNILARQIGVCSGADIENFVNEAAILAVRENSSHVYHRHFEEAIDKVRFGFRKKNLAITDDEKRRTAYHETGHALITYLMEKDGGYPFQRVNIIPRDKIGGFSEKLMEGDRVMVTPAQLIAHVTSAYGSYAAELKEFKNIASGVEGDLEQADTILYRMVTRWGMSKLGPISFQPTDMPYASQQSRTYSEATKQRIDAEVDRMRDECRDRAINMLNDNEHLLHALAKELLEKETLGKEEFETIIEREERIKKAKEQKDKS